MAKRAQEGWHMEKGKNMDRGGKEMEKEVIQPYYEDDYQSLDEMSTIDLLEMKDATLEELNEREHIIHRINQILDSRINGERPKLAKE